MGFLGHEHLAGVRPLQRLADADETGKEPVDAASGTMPRLVNTKPILAPVDAMRMSIGSVIVMPTPTA